LAPLLYGINKMVLIDQKQKITTREWVEGGERLVFPQGFFWGTATSAYQVEGNNKNSDWYLWERDGNIEDGQLMGTGPDHYRLFKEDLSLAAKLNNNCFRLSLEWSRIEPQDGQFDQKEIEHYRQVLQTAKKLGLQTFVTLHHFTNPLWFYYRGGWLNSEAPSLFHSYIVKVARELGSLVDFWLTINEPIIYAWQSYGVGIWPPGESSLWQTRKVVKHLAEAHDLAYRAIHQLLANQPTVRVGMAQNASSFQLHRTYSLSDQIYIRLMNYYFNHWFYDLTKGTHDFLGLNYYFHTRLQKGHWRQPQFINAASLGREVSDMGWEVYPHGLFEVLQEMSAYHLPIYVTENGIATNDEQQRAMYLIRHVQEIYYALQIGVPVKGFLYWSLLDNWEWDKGYWPHFGLVGYQEKTKKRIIKPAAKIYAQIAQQNALTKKIFQQARGINN